MSAMPMMVPMMMMPVMPASVMMTMPIVVTSIIMPAVIIPRSVIVVPSIVVPMADIGQGAEHQPTDDGPGDAAVMMTSTMSLGLRSDNRSRHDQRQRGEERGCLIDDHRSGSSVLVR